MRLVISGMLVGLLMWSAEAKSPTSGRTTFERVPKAALAELKATVGKPFTAGLVFIDGKYIEPPYKVERYGTAIRINGVQATGQVIAWDEFLKTQEGVKIEKAEAPAPAPESAVEEEVEEEVEEDPEEASGDDLDDLFDDAPAKPKAKRTVKRKVKKTVAAPAVPAPVTTVTFEGEFQPNERTKEMVARINKLRTKVELTLRNGGYCFFGSRYPMVTGERAVADMLLADLPKTMKENADLASFQAAAASRMTYLPAGVIRDLFRNRIDYLKLQERAKSIKGERQWEALLNQ